MPFEITKIATMEYEKCFRRFMARYSISFINKTCLTIFFDAQTGLFYKKILRRKLLTAGQISRNKNGCYPGHKENIARVATNSLEC